MSSEMMAALLGSGLLGGVGSAVMAVLRSRSDAQNADAHTLEVVHTVYDDTIETLSKRIDRLERMIDNLETDNHRLRRRVNELELFIMSKGLPIPHAHPHPPLPPVD